MILLSQTEKYRAESEQEARDYITKVSEEQYQQGYKLIDSGSKYRNKKVKGDIADEWYEVTIKKSFEE